MCVTYNTSSGQIENQVLPVTFKEFNLSKSSGKYALNWATESEINNSHYEIEYSKNGLDYSVIGNLEGKGNSLNTTKYSYQTKIASSTTAYFRLKQVDFNGDFSYSEIRSNGGKFRNISTSPNPTNGTLFINGITEEATVQLRNMNGQILLELNMAETKELDISHLQQGNYILTIQSADEVIQQKIVKY